MFLLLTQGRANHVAAHDQQKSEGQPVVEGFDQGTEGQPRGPADEVHPCLEEAEVPGQPECLPEGHLGQAGPGGQGDREGIHRQGKGDQEYRKEFHIISDR